MARNPNKKVVRAEHTAAGQGSQTNEPTFTPTPEAKGKATRLRLIAMLLWLLAIGGEAFGIFWVLKQDQINMPLLISLIVVIGILAIIGSVLWKKANRADPARRSEPFRFFVQNQLGAIIAIIAFLPLIIMIFTNKNMTKNQKNLAGIIAIVVAAIAVAMGIDFNAPSAESYAAETAWIVNHTGQDEVVWVTHGSVYHLCDSVSDVNLNSEDNTIVKGTVGDAHAAGMDRITLEWSSELAVCGFAPTDEVPPGLDGSTSVTP